MLHAIPISLMLLAGLQNSMSARVDAGPLKLDIYVSDTATLFHVVDQLSEWSEFSHQQYRRYFRTTQGELSDDDRAMLAEHAAIRKKYGWGQGPERVFYTQLALPDALTAAVKNGYLTAEEADVEQKVLNHFRPRIEALRSELQPNLDAFLRVIDDHKQELAKFGTDAAQFVGTSPSAPIPFYMIVNPDDRSMGGGYNGGILTLEIPPKRDAYPTLLHELFHSFIELKKSAIESAIRGVPGLDFQTVNEGLAYAISPGIYHTGDNDPLQAQVANYITRKVPLTDSITRFNFYALALRPLLKDALANKEPIEDFMPRAVDAWRIVTDLDKMRVR